MPKINFKATKMSEAKVSHISLVERGANRIPFKVVKQEHPMSTFSPLDLGNLFSRRKAEKVEPQVVAVVTMKGESLDDVKKLVEDAGFAVADVQEMEDGSVVFKQDGGDLDEAMDGSVVVRLNDHIALVTKGFSPYNMDVTADGVTFADQCAAKGFYPGVNAIMETLADAIRSIAYSAKTPAEAKAGVSKLFSEAAAYTTAFVGGLPQKAFKLEKLDLPDVDGVSGDGQEDDGSGGDGSVQKGAGEGEGSPDDQKPEGGAEGGANGGEGAGSEVTKGCKSKDGSMGGADGDGSDPESTAEEGADGKKKPAKKAGDSLTEEQVSSIVASQVESLVTKAMAGVLDKLEGMTGVFQEVQKSVADVRGGLESFSARVEQAESVAKAAKDAVVGTVVTGGEAGDHEPAPARKSETRGFGGEIDTAYMPRVRKTQR